MSSKSMTNSKFSNEEARTLNEMIHEQLPGWKLVNDEINTMYNVTSREDIDRGPSIKQLRQKFLDHHTVIKIQPVDGGPSKVAEIINGVIKTVQG